MSRILRASSRSFASTSTLSAAPVTTANDPASVAPYHPHVHVPLLSFLRSSSSEPSERLVVPLPTPLFNTPSRPSLLHKLVVAHLASLRAGNAATKNRSQVAYSGKKIRPQKGTGKARLGSRGSPMLRGGGHAFGLTPKGPDGWKRKVNRKEEQLGLRVGLSDKWRAGELSVVDRLGWETVSTRSLRDRLASRGWTDALFILGRDVSPEQAFEREAFFLAAGNLPGVAVLEDASDLGIWEIVKRRKVIIELAAVDEVIARLDPENKLGFEDEAYVLNEAEEDAVSAEIEDALAELSLNNNA